MIPEDLLASLDRVAKLPAVGDFINSLLWSRRTKNLACAKRLHAQILNSDNLRSHGELGNYLVPTLVDCGSLHIAQRVFDSLDRPKACSWTALVQGCNEDGKFQEALDVLHRMRVNNVQLSSHTFQALVKTCAMSKNLDCGRELHLEITKWGHESNQIVGVTLVDMYVKSALFADAWTVLVKLPVQDVVSYNIFITDYAKRGQGELALKCLERLQSAGASPDVVSLAGSLKACSVLHNAYMGRDIHRCIVKLGLDENAIICNTLVDMYAKVGSLQDAQEVFDKMLIRNVVSWNALLNGYAEHGFEKEVLSCLEKMNLEGLSWSHVSFVSGLSCCGSLGEIDEGCKLHADAVKLGLESHVSVGCSLVEMYTSVGWIDEGQQVFHILPIQNVVSWTALITGYAEHGLLEAALEAFTSMQSKGVRPDTFLFVCILECCCIEQRNDLVYQIHSFLAKDGLELDSFIASALVNAYTSGGLLSEAQYLFDELPVSNALSCDVSVSWYSEHNVGAQNLLGCVEKMLLDGSFFSPLMLVGSLKACASVGDIKAGTYIHMKLTKEGFDKDPSLGNALVAMYSNCRWFEEAIYICDNDQLRQNASCWNTLMASYADNLIFEQVLICSEKMKRECCYFNEATFVYGLKACASLGDEMKGFELHADLMCEGLEGGSLIGNSLVAVYIKRGLLAEAWDVFKEMAARDVVSWNSMMAGHAECGSHEEVLNNWEQMQAECISPNCVSYVIGLKACSSIGAVDKGLQLQAEVIERGFEQNPYLMKVLLDNYAKSGLLAETWAVFNKLPIQDTVLWTALIGGFACCGCNEFVFRMLEIMGNKGIQPNERTYLNVLTVCDHSGLVEESYICFQTLHQDYSVIPLLEHYNCTADVLGRAGQLKMAVALLEVMPFQPDLVAWRAIMGASRKWKNLEAGRQAFEGLMALSDREVAACMLMLNIFAEPEESV